MRLEGTLLDTAGKVSLLLEKALKPGKSCFLPLAESHKDAILQQPSWNCEGKLRSNNLTEVTGGEREGQNLGWACWRAADSLAPGTPGPGPL